MEILCEIALPSPDYPPNEIWQKHESAFNIERVTKEFFERYRETLHALMDKLQSTQKETGDREKVRKRRFEFAQLFLNHLYGVDVKDWAVRACELRLFLSLLVELPDKQLPKSDEPILPNLDFRIRVGDSIVQEVPELPYPLILRRQQHFVLPIQRELARQIQDLIRLKQELEEARITDLGRREREIWRKEREIIAQLLERVSEALKRRIANGKLPSLKCSLAKMAREQALTS